MGTPLESDDIRVGQFVMITDGPLLLQCRHESDGVITDTWAQERSLEGMPLRVIAVDRPFILVDVVGFGARKIIDTRTTPLATASQEYVAAFCPQAFPAMQHQHPQQSPEQQPGPLKPSPSVDCKFPWEKFTPRNN